MHFIHPAVTLKASMVPCFYKGHLRLLSESNPALASCRVYERNDTKHYSLTKGDTRERDYPCDMGASWGQPKKDDSRKECSIPHAEVP